jgi:site-specific recombinase XerD
MPKLLEQARSLLRTRNYSLCEDVSTTMIYTHVLNKGCKGVRSPLEL